MGYYNSFVVRIWAGEPEGTMRGHIQHVSTQEGTHFLNLDKMVDFIIAHLNPSTGSQLEGTEEEMMDDTILGFGRE
jgi:hypothetical protein